MKRIALVVSIVAMVFALACSVMAQDSTVKEKYKELKDKSAVALRFESTKPEEGHGRWFTLITNKYDQDTGEKKTVETPVKTDHVETELQQLIQRKEDTEKSLAELTKKIESMQALYLDMGKLLPK